MDNVSIAPLVAGMKIDVQEFIKEVLKVVMTPASCVV